MNNVLSLLFILLFLAGCQVKSGGAGGSDILVGHIPNTNKFTVASASPRAYSVGKNIDFYLTFPVAVTVTGTPDFGITVGATARVATYFSGSGSTSLLFRYTVQAGENDSDGISMGSTINLNGGTLKYATTLDCNLLLTAPSLTNVKVDNVVPTLTSVTAPANGTYLLNTPMNFTANFSENVIVTGTPRLILDIGGAIRYATYVSGSGGSSLVFRYTVTSTDTDNNGIGLSSPIDLNAGVIADAASLNSSLIFTAPNTIGVLVAGDAPFITSVTPPANGTYTNSNIMDFVLNFNENVNIVGIPRLTLNIGGVIKFANYFSGSGTSAIRFRYVVIGGDLDPDGIGLSNSVDLNGGTIRDAGLNNAILGFGVPNLSAVTVFTTGPSVVSVAIPGIIPPGGFDVGASVDFKVTFSESMTEVGGASRLKLDIGGVLRYAVYFSGSGTASFIYRYLVAAGEEDLNGLSILSPLELNGSTIQSGTAQTPSLGFTAPNSSTVLIDSKAPTIVSNTVPAPKTYKAAETLDYVVTFSEPVKVVGTPRIALDIGGVTRFANYLSGSGSSSWTFRYTLVNPDVDTNGISSALTIDLNAGSIQDPKNHNASSLALPSTDTSLVNVDTVVPTILSVAPPANATYLFNQNVNFTVNVSEPVVVTGNPRISINVGGITRFATYISGSGTASLVFRYTVANGDMDSDGIILTSPIDLNGGAITDGGTNNSSLTYTLPNTSAILINGVGPLITSVTPPANATFLTGDTLSFVVNYSEPVVVTLIPRIAITLESGTVFATYASGGGTNALTFSYAVAVNQFDTDGIVMVSPIDLNGGNIQNVAMNQVAGLTYTLPTTTGILVDGVDPSITSVTPPANATYGIGQNLDYVVNYSSKVVVTGLPTLSQVIGAISLDATYLSGSGTNALIFRYTVATTDTDIDGVATSSPLVLAGGTINDPFGDPAGLIFTPPNTSSVNVDGTVPTISSVSPPLDGTYRFNQKVNFTVNFSENITVTGSPRLTLNVGGITLYATYTSGSGTSNLVFRYTVGNTHQDLDGISITTSIDLNSGTLKDIGGNNVNPLTFTAPNLASVLVDGRTPYIVSLTPPANGTFKTTNNLDFVFVYSVPINVTGVPRIALTVGADILYANYTSGSGTDTLTFRYSVAGGNMDTDGIAMAASIALNGGTMVDGASNPAQLTYTSPNLSLVLVDGIDIVISSITPPADATYKIGDAVNFTVNYNYAATVTLNPRITLMVGIATRYATYVSGSGTTAHLYTYTVASTENDTDGIDTVGPTIDLNGGMVRDAFADSANLSFTGTNYLNKKVDGIRPTISSSSVSANKTYLVGENIDFTLTYSENVTFTGTPRLVLTVGATTLFADYNPSTSTATAKVFRYTVAAGQEDIDGIAASNTIDLNGGAITDVPGNAPAAMTYSVPVLANVKVDGIIPSISSIFGPGAATYGLAANLDFTVNFTEAVMVASGIPTLSLNIGGAIRTASYLSGSGSTALIFRYTTVLNDGDTNGVDVTVDPISLGAATIKDISGNNAVLTFAGANYVGVLVDAIPPAVSSVNVPGAASYQNGGINTTLTFTVIFNENVTVNTGAGIPRIHLTIGSTPQFAAYTGGTGTNSLTFSYVVATTDLDMDGIAVANSSNIDLNGGIIRDALANNANLAMGATNTANVFVVFPNMRNWYDLSDSTKIITAGLNVTGLTDKIGTYNLTHSSGAGFAYSATGFNGGSSAYMTCTSATWFNNATAINQKAVLAVFRAPTTNAGHLFWSNSSTQPRILFASANNASLGDPGGHYSGTTFGTGSTTAANFWTSSGGQTLFRAVQWDVGVNRATRLCQMNGEMAEFIMFSSNPTSTQLTAIESFITAKHGVALP